jgi:hypothetical protein
MFADRYSLLNQAVQILWDGWSESFGFQNSENFVSGDESHLGDTVRIPEDHTDLRRGQTLFGEFVDLLLDVVGCQF